jgi:hypothetical protein
MPTSPQDRSSIRSPHPLAVELARRLSGTSHARVLDYCSGSGRNAAWLEAGGLDVVAIADDAAAAFDRSASGDRFAGIVSSHGLLHGYASAMGARVHGLAEHLHPEGWLCATFGSKRDARYGTGTRLENGTFASESGDEAGVAHAYFDEPSLRALLEPDFDILELAERDAGQTAGTWAHSAPLTGALHWFFVGRRRERGDVQ